MIGDQDLKFNDLNKIDFLQQNKVESAKQKSMSKRSMSYAAAPEMAMMAEDDMGMPENSNALDSLFVYKMSSVNL